MSESLKGYPLSRLHTHRKVPACTLFSRQTSSTEPSPKPNEIPKRLMAGSSIALSEINSRILLEARYPLCLSIMVMVSFSHAKLLRLIGRYNTYLK